MSSTARIYITRPKTGAIARPRSKCGTVRGGGADDPHRLSPPFDGSTFSGQLSVERTTNDRISLGVEISEGPEITRTQTERTTTTIGRLNGRHRDTFGTAVVKFNVWTRAFAGGRPGAHIELDA